jgi:hypothetical protein
MRNPTCEEFFTYVTFVKLSVSMVKSCVTDSAVDPYWFQCKSGSRDFMKKNGKFLQVKKILLEILTFLFCGSLLLSWIQPTKNNADPDPKQWLRVHMDRPIICPKELQVQIHFQLSVEIKNKKETPHIKQHTHHLRSGDIMYGTSMLFM